MVPDSREIGNGAKALVLATCAAVFLIAGCPGSETYELRVDRTRAAAQDQKNIEHHLVAVVNQRLHELGITLRIPRSMAPVATSGQSAGGPRFDLEMSFAGPARDSRSGQARLHLVAREREAQVPAPRSPSGATSSFEQDLLALVDSRYQVRPRNRDVASLTYRGRHYHRFRATTNDQRLVVLDVRLEGDPRVALIWELPAEEANSELMIVAAPLVLGTLSVRSEEVAESPRPGGPVR
jgi:hypothetical protein